MGFGNRLLIGLEEKFGKLAFPAILRWVAGFQLMGFFLVKLSPPYAALVGFDRAKILEGEVWRLFTWLVIPETGSLLFLITVLFMFFLNDALEEAIGTFRLNVYVLMTAVCITGAAMSPLSNPIFTGLLMNFTFFSGMVLAVACFFPNYTIQLMLVIPIKLKWLAWIDVAYLVSRVAPYPLPLINTILVLFSLLPFLVGIFPAILTNLKNEANASARRAKFQRNTNGGTAFHTCHLCGITDEKDPNMEFRVSAEDGEEYCLPCREKKK